MSLLDLNWDPLKGFLQHDDGGGNFTSIVNLVFDVRGAVNTIRDDLRQRIEDGVGDALDAATTKVGTQLSTWMGDMANGFFDNLYKFLTQTFGAAPSTTALQPIDPTKVFDQIASAISGAETKLNAESLVISNGTVEIDFYVDDGTGKAGSHAKVVFTISPRQ